MKQFFIATPYSSYIGANTITAIRVEHRKSVYSVIISSTVEHDFCYASAELEKEAEDIAEQLIQMVGIVIYSE